MVVRKVSSALVLALSLTTTASAQDALVTYKSLSPELALDLARAALNECRKRGYQAAVAVVDRFGVTQVMLRDRFAGAHTPATAAGKAWTAASFRTNTTELVAMTQPGMETQFGFEFTRDIFLEDPVFKQFIASAPFKAWLPK